MLVRCDYVTTMKSIRIPEVFNRKPLHRFIFHNWLKLETLEFSLSWRIFCKRKSSINRQKIYLCSIEYFICDIKWGIEKLQDDQRTNYIAHDTWKDVYACWWFWWKSHWKSHAWTFLLGWNNCPSCQPTTIQGNFSCLINLSRSNIIPLVLFYKIYAVVFYEILNYSNTFHLMIRCLL